MSDGIVIFEDDGLRYKLAKPPHQNKTLVEINGDWITSTMPAERVREELARMAKRKQIEVKKTPEQVIKAIAGNGRMTADAKVIDCLRKSEISLSPYEITDECALSNAAISQSIKRLYEQGVLIRDEPRKINGSKSPSKTYRLNNIFKGAA